MRTNTTHWKCDSCGKEDTTEMSRQPDGWIAVALGAKPEIAPDEMQRMHCCGPCARDMHVRFGLPLPAVRAVGVSA